MIGRLKNLYRIQKLYGLIREWKKKGNTEKYWKEIYQLTAQITEVKEMFSFLKGYKTYIIAALVAAVNMAYAMGYIDENTKNVLLGLLGAGAISTVAAKINRLNEKKDDSN